MTAFLTSHRVLQQAGYTALTIAIEQGRKAVSKLLIEQGADVSVTNTVRALVCDAHPNFVVFLSVCMHVFVTMFPLPEPIALNPPERRRHPYHRPVSRLCFSRR